MTNTMLIPFLKSTSLTGKTYNPRRIEIYLPDEKTHHFETQLEADTFTPFTTADESGTQKISLVVKQDPKDYHYELSGLSASKGNLENALGDVPLTTEQRSALVPLLCNTFLDNENEFQEGVSYIFAAYVDFGRSKLQGLIEDVKNLPRLSREVLAKLGERAQEIEAHNTLTDTIRNFGVREALRSPASW